MIIHQLLTNAKRKAFKLLLNKDSKYILFSDLHKGDNSYADDFVQNMRIYKEALHHYYIHDYTYIELGDGIELWENKKIQPIIKAHHTIFDLLKEFHNQNRLHLIYGNHDMIMMYPFMVKKLLGNILPKIQYHESILLQTDKPKHNILLLHGHQADYLNYYLWWFYRFMVRYIWKPLQLLGINDPTSPAKNFKELIKVERRMENWIVKNAYQPVIFGHTHRPRFPINNKKNETHKTIPMFNTGSCVHPDAIIGIEIEDMEICMVRWEYDTTNKSYIRIVIEGPTKISDYFLKLNES